MSKVLYTKSYQQYLDSIPKVATKDLTEIVDDSMIQLSQVYARQYKISARNFINCFLNYPSIRTACAFIVQSYKHKGIFSECQDIGKDFTEYAEKQVLEDKWKRVLADVLLILYSIIHIN